MVSLPSTSTFDAQDAEYRESVLPRSVTKRITIEASHYSYWCKYVGLDGRVIGMRPFGESGKAEGLFAHFGFTVDQVVTEGAGMLHDES
ncbi:Transketolase [Halomonas citrativorans]|uniref:Transketolase n=1 Tax=Halomonas citrativorans TaxID=2742612 RepID=A0A1R4HNS7_9GAMM|nr:Transketolase [Halomonas citrativorans]